MIELDGTGRRQYQFGPRDRRQFSATRHIVVMNMSLEHISQLSIGLAEDEHESINVTLRVDDECPTFVDDDVGVIPEAGSADRYDLHRYTSSTGPRGVSSSALSPGSGARSTGSSTPRTASIE